MQEPESVNVFETNKNILNLSDEVLVHICTYVSSADIISLSSSCTRFNDLLCERKLIRELNLKAMYSLTSDMLRFFLQPVVRCENVNTISLSSCYWLTSRDILWSVGRLINLKTLHVEDTNLSIQHLTRILKSITSINCVSWTFHMTHKISLGDVKALSEEFQRMKYLNLWMKGYAVPFIPVLLHSCPSLEELKLSSYKYKDVPRERTSLLKGVNCERFELPNIKTLILNVPEELVSGWFVFITRLCCACAGTSEWHCLWLDTKSDASLIISLRKASSDDSSPSLENVRALSNGITEEDLLNILQSKCLKYFKYKEVALQRPIDFQNSSSKITHLSWQSNTIPSSWPAKLQHLHIPCTHRKLLKSALSIPYDNLIYLTRLSVPLCMFIECLSVSCQCQQVEEMSQWRGPRHSSIQKTPHTNCLLKIFSEIAPNVQELEIKCPPKCMIAPGQIEMASLTLISRWSNLESLFLEKIPVIDISFLQEVCSKCPKLRRLGLNYVGIPGYFSQTKELVQSIYLLRNLEDFRLEHPVVDKLTDITNALSECSKLRRVCIFCERTSTKQNMASYLNLIEKCKQLVFLFVRVASVTQKNEDVFKKECRARFMSERKSLWASVQGTRHENFWEIIPSIHCYEMVVDPALLSVMPPFRG